MQISPTSPGGRIWSLSSRMATSMPERAAPQEARRSLPGPSRMWSSARSYVPVMGDSVWAKSCTKTGPMRAMASRRSSTYMGEAP